jgi:Ni,Fe-hydrogenase I small subunit
VLKKDNIIKTVGDKVKKGNSSQKKPIVKKKVNKLICDLTGCPPDMHTSLNTILKYYGKAQAPNLSFYNALINHLINKESERPIKKKGVTGDV